jgi:ribosomal protein S12 methylthiotransferase
LSANDIDCWFSWRNRRRWEELKEFLEQHRFDRVGIFTYSHEEGTSGYMLTDDVLPEEKERRAQEIMEVQQEISFEMNQQKVGKVFKTIIDKKESGPLSWPY